MTEPIWRSAISHPTKDRISIRGYDILDLMQHRSFGDMVYLLFKGELPSANDGRMVEAIIVCCAEHSVLAPSTNAARFVASCGVPVQASVAAGIIALGEYHGGAIEECARMLQTNIDAAHREGYQVVAERIVEEHQNAKKRILGFGHAVHHPDPRRNKLFDMAQALIQPKGHIDLVLAIEGALKKALQRELPANVDGAIAAIISDMGFDWRFGKGFFLIGRSAGLTAHVFEQMTREKPFKIFSLDEIGYDGPPDRPLPM